MISPFNPIITGPILYLLTNPPNSLKPHLLSLLTHLPSTITLKLLVSIFKALFSLGLVYKSSSALTERSLNNGLWRGDKGRWRWEDEVAVVTGGCSGIGEEIVKSLAGRGVKVVVLDVADLPDRLKDVVSLYIKTDITDLPSVRLASTQIQDKFKQHPSILINNAGIGGGFGMLECDVDKVKKVLEVNLISHWITCSVFVPPMVKANKGHIVELASMSSFVSVGSFSDYSAGKAALVSFAESLRDQLRWYYKSPQVHVTIVHPLWVSTPLVAHAKTQIEASSGPMLTPEEVAGTITEQIWRCRGSRLIIPGKMGWLYTTRAWPVWMLDLIKGGGREERSFFMDKAAGKE